MSNQSSSCQRVPAERLSDDALTAEVHRFAAAERQTTAQLIALLAEFDVRRLYLGAGCSSMFTYCTQVLRLSEHAAYGRIEAARAGRRFPIILEWLAEGALTLTAVTLLGPHLTADNHRRVLEAARHKSKREVERLLAAHQPRPDVPATIRKLPAAVLGRAQPAATVGKSDGGEGGTGSEDPAGTRDPAHAESRAGAQDPAGTQNSTQAQGSTCTQDTAYAEDSTRTVDGTRAGVRPSSRGQASVTPLSPERYKLQLTVARDTHDKLRRAQELARHAIPDGDLATILDRALDLLLRDLERRKLAAAARPRPHTTDACAPVPRSRHVPAAVRRAVWNRDAGRCRFVGRHGRCRERALLEFHHVVPHALGGGTTAENLQLRCRAHNLYEAERTFSWRGPASVPPRRGAARSAARQRLDD